MDGTIKGLASWLDGRMNRYIDGWIHVVKLVS